MDRLRRVENTSNIGNRGRRPAVLFLLGVMVCAAALASTTSAFAVTYRWSIFAGVQETAGTLDGPALVAQFSDPYDVAQGPDGSFYVADSSNHSVRKIARVEGVWQVSTIATQGAGLWYPGGVTCDSDGNVYVTSTGNGRLLKITSAGVQSLWHPEVYLQNSVVGPDGYLYATGGNAVWRYNLDGTGETRIAGTGEAYESDGTSTTATFNDPRGIACDAEGNLFVTDYSGQTIRRVDRETRQVSTVAGFPQNSGSTDGVGSNARFDGPMDVAYDAATGDLVVADQSTGRVRGMHLEAGGWRVTTLSEPIVGAMGVCVADDGSVYVAAQYAQEILRGEALPEITGLASPTHPDDETWYSNSAPKFTWDSITGVQGYSYDFDHSTEPDVDNTVDAVDAGYVGVQPTNETGTYYDVAVGDFNKDGVKDVVGTLNHNPDIGFQINLGDGDGGYAAPVTYPVSTRSGTAGPWHVMVGDFNDDGYDDIAVTSGGWSASASVYLNDPDVPGTFGPEHVLYTGGYYGFNGAVGDVDGDGNLDIVVACHYATPDGQDDQHGGDVRVLKGNGDGTFQDVVAYPTALHPLDVALADMNGDDKLDIVTVSTDNPGLVSVLLNDGDGTFPVPEDRSGVPTFEVDSSLRGLAVADFDGDGAMDVATIDRNNWNVALLRGHGDGLLLPAVHDLNGVNGYALAAGDLNGDGAPDLTLASGVVALNDGSGGFPASAEDLHRYGGDNGFAYAVADMNGDGLAEIVAADSQPFGYTIASLAPPSVTFPETADGIWYFHIRAVGSSGLGGATENRRVLVDTTAPTIELSGITDAGVYLQDAVPRVVLTASDPNMPDASGIASLRYFSSESGEWVTAEGDTASFDLPDRPGSYDILCDATDGAGNVHYGYFSVSVIGPVTGLTSPTHPDPDTWYSNNTPAFDWDVASGSDYSYVIDQSADTVPDTSADPVAQAGLLAPMVSYPTGSDPEMIASGDFNEDGHADLALANYDDNSVTIQLNQAQGTFQDHIDEGGEPTRRAAGKNAGAPARSSETAPAMSFPVGKGPAGVAVADFNGDDHLDLAVADYDASAISILLGAGDGTFRSAGTVECISGPWQLASGDFNGDGRPDIAVGTLDENGFEALTNDGDGGFTSQTVDNDESGQGSVVVADFNGDGRGDIACGIDDGVCVAYNDGNGVFSTESMQFIRNGEYPTALAAGDIDGDGHVDIYAPDESEGTGFVLWNDPDDGFDSENVTALEQISCCSYGGALGDVNGDGKLDLVDCNEDEYTVSVWLYRGERQFGERQDFGADSIGYGVVASDFNGDGLADVATGNNESGVSVLLAGATSNVTCGPLEDGAWYFHVRPVGGETGGVTRNMRVNIDTLAPVTTLLGVPDGWSNSMTTMTLDAVDPGYPDSSGVDRIAARILVDGVEVLPWQSQRFYMQDGAIHSEGSLPPIAGNVTLQLRSTDVAGNQEQVREWDYKCDPDAPTVEMAGVTDGATYTTPQRATLTATDTLSGVKGIDWKLGDSDWTETTGEITAIDIPATTAGTFTYTYRAVDVAGNYTEPQSFTVTVEAPPTVFAHDDTATAYSRPAYVQPLVNDDPGVGGVLSFTQPDNGSVVRASGPEVAAPEKGAEGRIPGWDTLIYTPHDGFLGDDVFTYSTTGGQTATVTITVVPGLVAPTGVHVSRVTSTSVNVSWDAPASFGSGFAKYNLSWRPVGSGDFNGGYDIQYQSPTICTVIELVPGADYEFKLTVTDTGDFSASAAPVEFHLAGDPPAAVFPPVTVSGSGNASSTVHGVSPDASLTVDPDVADETTGVASVTIDGLTVTVVPDPGFSGVIELPVTVTQDGASSVVIAQITVNPGDPYNVTFGPSSATKTRVQWAGSLNATGYRISVGGTVVATVGPNVSSYSYAKLLGPNAVVAVQAIGNGGTTSHVVRGTYQPGAPVMIGTITFAGDSAKLSASAKKTLRKLAALVKAQGFTSLTIKGFTERHPHGNAAFRRRLSAARARAVTAFLTAEFKRLHVKVKFTVVSTNGSGATGSAKYRRAEIVLSGGAVR